MNINELKRKQSATTQTTEAQKPKSPVKDWIKQYCNTKAKSINLVEPIPAAPAVLTLTIQDRRVKRHFDTLTEARVWYRSNIQSCTDLETYVDLKGTTHIYATVTLKKGEHK